MTAGQPGQQSAQPPGQRPAQRLEPMPGGWLLARDLRDMPERASVRLAQHHIAVHRTWGISAGLEVTGTETGIRVSPGAALDRRGRIAVLPEAVHCAGRLGAVSVVLVVTGEGPAAGVRLRPPGQLRDLDIPLAAVDLTGTVHAGDGDRQWLRRPGPARCISGLIARGAPVTGVASAWTASVGLAQHGLDGAPAVVVSAAGPPRDVLTTLTTFEVTGLTPAGFDIIVRHHVRAGDQPSGAAIATAPQALSWIALLSAERPAIPTVQEQS